MESFKGNLSFESELFQFAAFLEALSAAVNQEQTDSMSYFLCFTVCHSSYNHHITNPAITDEHLKESYRSTVEDCGLIKPDGKKN